MNSLRILLLTLIVATAGACTTDITAPSQGCNPTMGNGCWSVVPTD